MNDSKTIIELVFKLADQKKITMTELAKRVGVAKSSLSRYKSGERDFPINDIGTYAKVLNVPVEYLLGLDNVGSVSQDYNFLPTAISAGLPINIEGIMQADKVSLPDSIMGKWAGNKEIYVTKISGDSMDKVMSDGSLIAVKPVMLDEIKNGDMIVFSDNHEYSVKYYHRKGDKLIFKPSSNNEAHYDQMYSVDDNITIHGRVVMYIVELD